MQEIFLTKLGDIQDEKQEEELLLALQLPLRIVALHERDEEIEVLKEVQREEEKTAHLCDFKECEADDAPDKEDDACFPCKKFFPVQREEKLKG